MSHLRDLQKLRNTRNNIPLKRTTNHFHLAELKPRNNIYQQTNQHLQNNHPNTAREQQHFNNDLKNEGYPEDSFAKYLQQK